MRKVFFVAAAILLFAVLITCRHAAKPPLPAPPPPPTASPTTAASCAHCPVPSVDSKAGIPFSPPNTAAGCVTQLHSGFPVPDPRCTPGAINPTITVAVLLNTMFRTACIRNCVSTESQKNAIYKLYNIPHPANNTGATQTCELDHLVPLELGGADSLDNIWPQCGPPGVTLDKRFFKQKDLIENFLTAQVKAGAMDQATAQRAIATDWPQFIDRVEHLSASR